MLVLTTWPADTDIESVARHLIERHLAACITVLPAHRAIYRWNTAIETADENRDLRDRLAARPDQAG